MVQYTYNQVVPALDNAVNEIEKYVEAGQLNQAEELRLRAKTDMRDVTEPLETFSGELSQLVIVFANIAHVPITLKQP
jgi:hypothetical protein